PLAGLGLFYRASYLRHDVVPRARFAKVETEPVLADAGEVAVAFDESGNGELSVKVDDFGLWALQPGHLRIGADRDDLVAANRDRLSRRLSGIHRDHLPALQDQSRRLGEHNCGARQERKETHKFQDSSNCVRLRAWHAGSRAWFVKKSGWCSCGAAFLFEAP